MREHGITMPSYNVSGDMQFFTLHTLFDISKTGVLKTYSADIPAFLDDSDQLVRNQSEWNRSRNQQRNWETIMQLIGMRSQPIMLETPVKIQNCDIHALGMSSKLEPLQTVWVTSFATEHAEIYASITDPVGLLKKESHLVPMIAGLKETVNFDQNCLITLGDDKNTIFSINNTLPTRYVL
jgi:hypothetical protein